MCIRDSPFSASSLSSHSLYIQAFLLQANGLKILLFNVYIPPVAPSRQVLREDLENLVLKYSSTIPLSFLLILEYLNSRIGPSNSALALHMNWNLEDLTPPCFLTSRTSKDHSFNSYTPFLLTCVPLWMYLSSMVLRAVTFPVNVLIFQWEVRVSSIMFLPLRTSYPR